MEPATLHAPSATVAKPLAAADYARLARELSAAGAADHLRPLSLAMLSSCTTQFIEPALVVESARRGFQLRPYFGPFAQFEQQVADQRSELHSFAPDVLVLFMRPEDLDADFVARHYAHDRSTDVLQATIDRLIACVAEFRRHSAKPVLVANFATPAGLPLGPFDANVAESLTYVLADANRMLRTRLAQFPDAIVWDYAGLVRESGASSWTDGRLWAIARLPVAADRQPLLARHLARSAAGILLPPAKCLVLDLDNTLWGGVVGDDGIEGIQLGDDYPGNIFKSFQRAVLGLADRGVLLAVVSKNYSAVVDQVFREHPEMLIKLEHLSALRVNWQPKSQNLREIAAELNIGLDALVHFDDNPAERAEIAAHAPEVRLVDVPNNPLDFERALRDCGHFDAVTISEEDRQRVGMYRTEQVRDQVRASAQSVEAYLGSLEMVAETNLVDAGNLGRVAQLIGKTNQFNLTTRRHSQAELSGMCKNREYTVHYVRLRDRFGDLGLIAVGVVAYQEDDALIDTFLMSCRAMGRQVEMALMHELVSAARARGCRRLIGEYLPTPKNGIVANLYSTLGFSKLNSLADGGERFFLDLDTARLEWPAAIRRSITLTEAT